MENKVTIVGYTGSGKTTYLIGMYMCMSGAGCKHYTIGATDPNQDMRLEQMWDKLCDGEFPDASFNSEKYSFHIAHNYKPVCDFNWLDYPGGVLSDPGHEDWEALRNSICSSDSLLLVLDGEKFVIDAKDEEEYEEKLSKKIKYDKGMRSQLKEFNNLSAKGTRIPPTCIMITKCDLIDPDYRNVIERVLKESMSSLFESTLVIITSVSLGANISEEGPDPFCVEEPIAFAVLTILMKYVSLLSEKKNNARAVLNKERNFFTEWLDALEIERAKKELKNLNEIGDKWVADAYKLIELFDSKKNIFVEGVKQNFCQYMRKEFSEINSLIG